MENEREGRQSGADRGRRVRKAQRRPLLKPIQIGEKPFTSLQTQDTEGSRCCTCVVVRISGLVGRRDAPKNTRLSQPTLTATPRWSPRGMRAAGDRRAQTRGALGIPGERDSSISSFPRAHLKRGGLLPSRWKFGSCQPSPKRAYRRPARRPPPSRWQPFRERTYAGVDGITRATSVGVVLAQFSVYVRWIAPPAFQGCRVCSRDVFSFSNNRTSSCPPNSIRPRSDLQPIVSPHGQSLAPVEGFERRRRSIHRETPCFDLSFSLVQFVVCSVFPGRKALLFLTKLLESTEWFGFRDVYFSAPAKAYFDSLQEALRVAHWFC